MPNPNEPNRYIPRPVPRPVTSGPSRPAPRPISDEEAKARAEARAASAPPAPIRVTSRPVTPPIDLPPHPPEIAALMVPKAPHREVIVPERLADLELLPENYEWRRGQREIVQKIVDSPKKIIMLEAECGAGKSLIGVGAAKASGYKAIVLIQTIALQEQYMRDFHASARMMNGRRNFTCNLNHKRADWAPCTVGMKCQMRSALRDDNGEEIEPPECDYYRAKWEAGRAQISIQNYAYWLAETKQGAGSKFEKPDWIICDEAHELDQILMSAGTIQFRYQDLRGLKIDYPSKSAKLEDWKDWAGEHINPLKQIIHAWEEEILGSSVKESLADHSSQDTPPDGEWAAPHDSSDFDDTTADLTDVLSANFESKMTRLRIAKEILSDMEDLTSIIPAEFGDWVTDSTTDLTSFLIKPIYGKYAFRRLLRASQQKIVLMSAFLAPALLMQTLDLRPEDVEVIDAGRIFDRSEDHVYYCPLLKFNYQTRPNEWKFAVKAMDRFINAFAPRKGLIQVPSLRLRNTVMEHTLHKLNMLAYDGAGVASGSRLYGDKDNAIRQFVNQRGQRILLGQSISTGLDIPMVPEFQIIPKLWYMPLEDPAVKARKAIDPSFYTYHTICQIIQATGRVKRSQDHHGQTVILDSAFGWFYSQNKEHFPQWFRDSLVWDGWAAFPGIKAALRSDAIVCGVRWSK